MPLHTIKASRWEHTVDLPEDIHAFLLTQDENIVRTWFGTLRTRPREYMLDFLTNVMLPPTARKMLPPPPPKIAVPTVKPVPQPLYTHTQVHG